MTFSKSSIFFWAAATMAPSSQGMPANPLVTFQESQPDGTIVTLSLNGGAQDSWMVDQDQYTVLKDPTTGFFVYARPDGMGGLEPSFEAVQNHTLSEDDSIDGPFYRTNNTKRYLQAFPRILSRGHPNWIWNPHGKNRRFSRSKRISVLPCVIVTTRSVGNTNISKIV